MDKLVTEWSSFPYLETANELCDYLQGRPRGHDGYYHYTSLDAINGILENGFCISSVDRFNDHAEKEAFEGCEKRYYCLCFSTGVEENLALWYLYAGVGGRGGRLQFTYKSISKLLRAPFELVEYNYSKHKAVRKIATLTEENASFRLGDVVYADPSKKNREFMAMKYNTMTNRETFPIREWEWFKESNKGFYKSQVWYYEKETRLMIELSSDLYKLIDPNKSYAVILRIPEEVKRYTKVRFAPNIKSLEDEGIQKYSELMKLAQRKTALQLSEHKDTVDIDPCRNCKKYR